MPEEDLQYIGRTIKEVVPRDNTVIYRGQGPQLFVRTYHTADSVIVPTIALQAFQEQAPHIDFYRGEAGRQLFEAAEMFHDMKNDRNFRGIRLDSIMEFVYKGNQDMRRFFISQVNKLPISEVKRAIGNTSLMKETKERLEDFFVQYREKNRPQLVYPGKQKTRVYFDMESGEQVEVPGRSSPVEIVTQRPTKPSEYDIFGPASPGKKKVRPGSFWTPDYDYAYSYINTEAKPAIYRIVVNDAGEGQLQKQVLTDAEWNKVRSPKVQKELVDYSNQLFQKGITGNSLRDVLTVLMFDEIKETNPGLVIQDVIEQHKLKNVDVAGARNIIKGYSLKLPNKMKGAAIAIPILGAIMSENQEESAVVGTAMAAGITLDPQVIKEEIAKVKERIKEYKDYGRRGNKEDIETAKEIYEDLQEQLKELNEQLKQSQTKPAKPKAEPKQAAAKKMIKPYAGTKIRGEQLSFSDYLKGLLGDERGAVYLPPWLTKVIQTREGPRMVDDPMTDVQELATGAKGPSGEPQVREEDIMELKEEVEGMDPKPRTQGAIADDPLTPSQARRVKNYENIVKRNIEAERRRQILLGKLEPRDDADRARLQRQANRMARQAAAAQALIDAEEVELVEGGGQPKKPSYWKQFLDDNIRLDPSDIKEVEDPVTKKKSYKGFGRAAGKSLFGAGIALEAVDAIDRLRKGDDPVEIGKTLTTLGFYDLRNIYEQMKEAKLRGEDIDSGLMNSLLSLTTGYETRQDIAERRIEDAEAAKRMAERSGYRVTDEYGSGAVKGVDPYANILEELGIFD